jgi:hypothetical protein
LIFLSSTIIHEIGHYLVLKFVFKEKDCGICLGNVKGRELTTFKFLGIRWRIFSLNKLSGSVGFVYPWNNLESQNKFIKILFYASGSLANLAVSVLLLIICISVKALNFHVYLYLKVFSLIFGLELIVNLLIGIFTRHKTEFSLETKKITKVESGYNDGYWLFKFSKLSFLLLLIINIGYLCIFYII